MKKVAHYIQRIFRSSPNLLPTTYRTVTTMNAVTSHNFSSLLRCVCLKGASCTEHHQRRSETTLLSLLPSLILRIPAQKDTFTNNTLAIRYYVSAKRILISFLSVSDRPTSKVYRGKIRCETITAPFVLCNHPHVLL